jgi:hypothetical protein
LSGKGFGIRRRGLRRPKRCRFHVPQYRPRHGARRRACRRTGAERAMMTAVFGRRGAVGIAAGVVRMRGPVGACKADDGGGIEGQPVWGDACARGIACQDCAQRERIDRDQPDRRPQAFTPHASHANNPRQRPSMKYRFRVGKMPAGWRACLFLAYPQERTKIPSVADATNPKRGANVADLLLIKGLIATNRHGKT